jgi:formate hydrogenlyase subunit 6/NADH:ubiquinone oxidoreductase subunit I
MRAGRLLRDMMRALFHRPVTRRYPLERRPAPERLRGALQFDPARCTGCCLCEKDCPAQALELVMVDRAAKRFVLRYHIDRCTFCAQCVQTCRFGCLRMSNEQWELAAAHKEPFDVYYGDEADVHALLAKLGRGDAEKPATT